VTYLGSGAFINCVNLDSIAVSNNNANFVVDENDGILYNIDKTILYLCPANNCVNNKTDIILPITLEKVMEGAFSYSRLQGICFTSPNVELESYSINTPYLSAVRILCSSSFTYAGSVDPTNLGNIFGEFIPSNFYVTSTDIKNNIQNYYTDSTVTEYDSEDWLGLVDYENNFIYSLQNRIDVNGVTITEVVILGARSTSSIMDIPSTLTLENYSVVKIAANAFAYDKNITRITLPSAIVEIEKCAFENMPNLTSITLDDNLTIIGDRAFYGSNKLATISFSENMNLESVGDKAFEDTAWYDNDSQVMITINDWLIKYHGYGVTANIPSNIKYIASEAFINKTNLTSIDFGNLSEAKLINIENNAFQSCKSLVQITLPATLVRVGDDAFMDCDKLILVTIQINKSDLGNIEFGNNAVPNSNIIHCFEGEEISYKLIYHVDENTDSVKGVVFVEPEYIEDNANRRFAGWYDESSYTNLTIFPLTLSDDNTTEGDNIRVKNIYAKFNSIENNNGGSIDLKFKLNDKNTYTVQEYVGNEKYVVIPKKYKGKNVTAIAENTFKDKDFIENISLPYSIEQSTGAKISDITYIGKDAFTGTAWYENILGDYIIVHDVLIRYKGEAHLVEIPANISSIADGAFYDNDFIEKVVIPVGVTEIGEYTFFDCNNLIEIELPNSILSIGEYAFASCDYLSLINFAKAQFLISIADNALNNTKWLDSVIDDSIIINSIFYKYQGKMSTLTISNGITQIASKAFYKNESLTTVNIPQSVDYIGEEAFYDTNIYKINIFSSGSKLTSIGNHAFDSCEKLEYIDLQSTKKLSYIGDYAFSGTVMLSTFIIPSSVEILGEGVFYNSGIRSLIFVSNSKLISLPEKLCENNMGLYEVIFNGASALNTIETKAFLNCSNLKLFRNISARLLSIGDEAFLGCGNLVAIEANTSQLNYIGINAIDDRYVTSLNSNMRIIGGVLIKYNGDEKVVEIPNNIFTIYDGAFEGKTALEEIIFPENSVIQRINNDAFANCTNLVNINFPDTISKVGDNVMLGTKWLDNQMRDENNDFIHISNSLIKYKGSEKRIVIPNYITVINSNAFDGIEFYNITIGSQLVEISENAFAGVIRPTVAYKLDETNDIVLADETDVNWNVILLSDNLSSNPIEVGENDNIPTIYVNSAKIKEDFYLDARWEAFDKTIKIAQYFKINYVIDVEKAIAMKLINDFMIYKEIEPEMLEGFLFAGWFLDAEYTKPLSYPLIISHDISIYAKFVSKSIGTEGGVFHFGSGEEINDIIKYIGDTDVTVVCPTTIATVDLLALTGKWKLAEGDEIATHKLNGDVYEVPIDSNDATHLYKGAFEDHNEIFKFYFADNSKITTIGKYAFRNCKSLKTIVLPSTIIAIDEYAFEGCTSLENIIFTNGEGTVTIGFGAFKDCTSLKSIILPNKVVLGDDVFEGCTSLVDVYSNTTEFADVQTLGGEITPFATSENLRIHVYASVYNFYYERWSVYKDNLVEVLDEEE
ncbi:MAG: leucine-rich repeat domain-containing protein, partial [Clostridia bacterium]